MSVMSDKIRGMLIKYAPYAPEADPRLLLFTPEGKQYPTTFNTEFKLPELYNSLNEILEYVEMLEEENEYMSSCMSKEDMMGF